MSGNVLKGGISYNKYIWHANEGACEVCQNLDGTEYEYEKDIPDKPHPNCQCYVETVDTSDICDCQQKIDEIIFKADELEGDIESYLDEMEAVRDETEQGLFELEALVNEIETTQAELESELPCGEDCIVTGMASSISTDVIVNINTVSVAVDEIYAFVNKGYEVYQVFKDHKRQMIEAKDKREDADKYYHAKANCESASLGTIETIWAIIWSVAKELDDYRRKVFKKGMDARFIFDDCMSDLKADLYGILKAKDHGYCSEKVKDAPILFPGPNEEDYVKH